MPAKEELPSTLQRSPQKAQRTWSKAHDAAVEEYGEGERAHRTAFSALKHKYEKVGDHWERKEKGKKGPSDLQAGRSGKPAREGGETAGGVDANATKTHLLEIAARLEVTGRSRMRKDELVEAIRKASDRETRKTREKSQEKAGASKSGAKKSSAKKSSAKKSSAKKGSAKKGSAKKGSAKKKDKKSRKK